MAYWVMANPPCIRAMYLPMYIISIKTFLGFWTNLRIVSSKNAHFYNNIAKFSNNFKGSWSPCCYPKNPKVGRSQVWTPCSKIVPEVLMSYALLFPLKKLQMNFYLVWLLASSGLVWFNPDPPLCPRFGLSLPFLSYCSSCVLSQGIVSALPGFIHRRLSLQMQPSQDDAKLQQSHLQAASSVSHCGMRVPPQANMRRDFIISTWNQSQG